MITEDFKIRNGKDWKKIHQEIFGDTIPTHFEWTNIDDIVKVLGIIGDIPNSNHLFLPDGGGLDLEGAKLSNEKGCIELDFCFPYIVKPKALFFESIDPECEWNYFRLELDSLTPSGFYEVRPDNILEDICELTPLEYIKRHHWDEYEYAGEKLPNTARPLIRYFKGSFVIFKKSSIYNSIRATYDGRHSKFDAKGFRECIGNAYKTVRGHV